jgi:membrane fusion protein, multidrug efflux system
MNTPMIVALLSFSMLTACSEKAAPPAPQSRTVLAYAVEMGAGFNHAEYSGEVKPRHETALAFRVGGKLIDRRVELGDQVSVGQVLARLDPADLAQTQKSAEALLAAAEADRTFARAEAERYRSLKTQQFVSAAALDAKETALKAAEEKVRAAAAQKMLAANQSGYAALSSDANGVVSMVLAEAGQVVAAGQPVLKVARTDEKEVLVAVPENRVAELSKAGEVVVTLWAAPDKRYRGRLREIAPQADPVTRTYAARVAILDADADVRLGQTARVLLNKAKAEAATLIPLGSVFQQGKQPAVWLIGNDGRVHLRPVQVAAWREDGVAVSGGLAAGERIVAAGAHKLIEGEVVRVIAP